MSYLDLYKIREEVVTVLRNADVFTTTQRGVVTTTEAHTAGALTYTLTQSNVRNVRSATDGATTLKLLTDYTVNYSSKVVTLTTTAASTATFVYDYGTSDKIFPDFPRNDLSISSFPRIGVDFIGVNSEVGGFGNVNVSEIDFMVVVYDFTTEAISNYISAIRQAIISKQTSFAYLRVIRPLRVGPLLKNPTEKGKDKLLQQNTDFRASFNYEKQ